MPIITLPDGSKREFDRPVSVLEVAQDIGAGLAKATIAGRVNGVRHDAAGRVGKRGRQQQNIKRLLGAEKFRKAQIVADAGRQISLQLNVVLRLCVPSNQIQSSLLVVDHQWMLLK